MRTANLARSCERRLEVSGCTAGGGAHRDYCRQQRCGERRTERPLDPGPRLEDLERLPLVFRDVCPPIVIATEHDPLQAAGAVSSPINAARSRKVATSVPGSSPTSRHHMTGAVEF